MVLFLTLSSAGLFLFYGFHCLFSKGMVNEFRRYGLEKFRIMTGVLEVAGALGQIGGLWNSSLAICSAGGLGLLMVCGLWTRWRVHDPWFAFIPAALLGLINGALLVVYF